MHQPTLIALTISGLLLLPSGWAANQPSASDYELGIKLSESGDYGGAIIAFSSAIGKDPKNAEAYSRRGALKHEKGDLPGALMDYQSAIELKPDLGGAYYGRGRIKLGQDDRAGALADFNRAIELDPNEAVTYHARGFIKRQQGDLAGALADFNQAIERNPEYTQVYSQRATLRSGQGDIEGAIADLNRVIELNPQAVLALSQRGLAKTDQGNLESAITDYQRALSLDSKFAPAYFYRGMTHYVAQRWAEAVTDFRTRCEYDEKDQEYPHFFIWLSRARLGETQAADQELSDFLADRPAKTSPDWPARIGEFLLGRLPEAQFLAAAEASSDPNTTRDQQCEAWFYVGTKKLLAEDKTAAAGYFRKCVAAGQYSFAEHRFAKAELEAIAEK